MLLGQDDVYLAPKASAQNIPDFRLSAYSLFLVSVYTYPE